MQMFLISDNVDTYTGMRLAGVEGGVVHEHDELKEALQKAGLSFSPKNSEENFPRLLMM